MNYSLSDNLTPAQFEELRASGEINPRATYEDYLALRRERAERRREAEEAARRDGYELGAPELELTPEDEAILERVWAELAAEKAAARERERLSRVA
jgi:hypothetical protein